MAEHLRIEFATPSGDDRAEMRFELRSIAVAATFADLVDEANSRPHELRATRSMQTSSADLEENLRILNGLITEFNETNTGSARLDGPVTRSDLSRQLLNRLHNQFESHAKAMRRGENALVDGPDSVARALAEINATIHRLETDINRSDLESEDTMGYFTANLRVDGDMLRQPLRTRDYMRFTMAERFGTLYANYATTGKNLQHIWFTDDLELLRGDGPSPQRDIASGVLAMFNSYPKSHLRELRAFARWWRENDIQRHGHKLWDIRNGYGMIELGRITPSSFNERFFDTATESFDHHRFMDAYAPYPNVVSMVVER